MSEMEIRINKRSLERTLFTIIIIALAVILYIKWDAPASVPDPIINVTALQADNDALATQIDELTAELEEAQRELELEQEVNSERDSSTSTETDEPEEEKLSGKLSIAWSVKMDSDNPEKLDRVVLSIVNGLDTTERLYYRLYWDGFFEQTVKLTDEVVVSSGETFSEAIVTQSEITTNPPSDIDTLVIEITDEDGDLVDKLSKRVR